MKKKNTGKKYIFLVLGLVVAALVIYFVVNNNNNKQSAVEDLQTAEVVRGELVAIVGATGTVRANQSAMLTWQTSGRIGEINVEVDDLVAGETVLAELLETSLSQSVILAQADLVTAEQNLDNLLNSNLAKAQAQLDLANAKDAYDRAVWSSFQENTVRTSNQNQIDAAKAAVTLAQDKVDDAQDAYDRVDSRDDDDPLKAGALSTLANARENLVKAKKDLNYLTQVPDAKELAISDGKIAVALAQYEDAQREWERQKDGPDPDDIAAAKARISAIQATINLASITAPFSGTVTEVSAMVGDQVNAGNSAFRIDDLSHLLVDVEVPEVDINSIRVGQDVDLTFDAIYDKAYQGRVTSVARVGSTGTGMVNFKVTIEILNPDEQVLPGMTAAVNIVTSRLEDVLTVPNRAVRLVNNQPVVYVLKNNTSTAVEIEIGVSSDTYSEVVSGDLKEGDLVILNPPTSILDFSGSSPF